MEQGSYMLIENGMTVRGTDADLGTVEQVVADTGVDVFRGIILSHGLLFAKRSLISADHIVAVTGKVVQVDISKSAAESLPPPMAVGPEALGKEKQV